ncbi:Hypothetical predicted protein [Octopus vulgaris]|uniref:Uncharacterized protein n=1 Tax=Octopus vulgaris TaxID=6645 RepID=A0AA36FFS9_OCTVU|nr:Hypothetical predicted protein [Octopus vulgaris]
MSSPLFIHLVRLVSKRSRPMFIPATPAAQCWIHCYSARHNWYKNQLDVFHKDSLTHQPPGKKTHEKVISFLDLVKPKAPFSRHGLQSKLETLEVLGCSLDQVQECPEILQVPQAELMHRATRLQQHGHRKINVQMLKLVHSKVSNAHLKRLQPVLDLMQGYNTITEYMMDVLKCNEMEFHEIITKIPLLKKLRNMPAFTEKVKYLQSFDVKAEHFIKYPQLLSYSLETLKRRIERMKVHQEGNDFPISSLAISEKQFKRFLNKYNTEQKVLDGSQNRYEYIAKLFNVSISVAEKMSYLENRRLTTLKPRVDFLLSVGIPIEHLRSHTYILRHKTDTLKKAYAKAQEAGIEKVSLLHIIHIISCKNVPLRVPSPKSTVFLPKLIGIDTGTLQKKLYHIAPLVTTDRVTLTTNFEYLTSLGITKKDICSCPLILSHCPKYLKQTVESIAKRQELQESLDLLSNPSAFVNLVQYLIEKEVNFRNIHQEVV